ncbi:MAG: hypothetical protein ACHQ52_15410 [Candidatus Eisenbacteria bacterium]
MQHRKLSHIAIALAAVIVVAGCGKSGTEPANGVSPDQLQVTTYMAGNPALVDDQLFVDPASLPLSRMQGTNAAITPRWFWRRVAITTPHLTFQFSDTDSVGRPRIADVTLTRHLIGTFNILPASPSDSTVLDTAAIVHKPLDDTWTRHLRFRRCAVPGSFEPQWRLIAASGVQVNSSGMTEQIQSVRVQTGTMDTTLTDPLALFTITHCMHMAAGDSVQLTVTTSKTDDVVLAYYRDLRLRFHGNGDGTYVIKLPLGELLGMRFFGVNALSRGTLFDDTLPYDSQAWLFHSWVGPPPNTEYYQ